MPGAWQSITEAFPPKPTWGVDDIPDLTGKVVIVTGATAGIGQETAKALLAHNAKVYVAARSETKAEETIRVLKELTGKEALFLKLDLGDLKSVKQAAEEFQRKETELHILFNNAGVGATPIEMTTVQGYDMHYRIWKNSPMAEKILGWMFYPAEYGALTQLWAGTSDEGLNMNGKFLKPWARYGSANPLALDQELGERLWKWLEEQTENI
ncbi:hypothetical protein CC2G_013116 [Coprinopsis cinerea AmutBmut pab1-1]|nr:hypothetical protein CC2G_013116 [Coprinopsis cinerea AmutBmut pab1-1]